MTQALASNQKSPETIGRLLSLLSEFDSGILVSWTRGGSLHGRPMTIARVDQDVTIWFITSVASAKVEELAEDARAMVTLQGGSRFLSLNGNVEIVFDPDQIKALWKESYRVWYQGETDPDIVLLRFNAFDAEYWDNSGLTGLKFAFEAARAYVSGQKRAKPELREDPESHAKLKLWDPTEASDLSDPES